MGLQGSQNLLGVTLSQPALLFLQPPQGLFGSDHLGSRRGQIFADVIKVDEVSALGAEVVVELFHDPRRAIAQAVDKGMGVQSTALGRLLPKQGNGFQRAQSRSIEPAHLLVDPGATHSHFIPGGRLALSPITGLARVHQGNHAPIDLRYERLGRLVWRQRFLALDLAGVLVGDPPNRVDRNVDPVMLLEPHRRAAKGLFSAEIAERPLQGTRKSAGLDLCFDAEGTDPNSTPPQPQYLLDQLNHPKGGLPFQFFFESLIVSGFSFWTSATLCSCLALAQSVSSARPSSLICWIAISSAWSAVAPLARACSI